MANSTNLTILIRGKKSTKSDNQLNLYARITYESQRAEISLGLQAEANDWDSKNGRAISKRQDSRNINSKIMIVRSDIYQAFQDLRAAKSIIDVNAIKRKYLGDEEKESTILDAFDYHKKIATTTLSKGSLQHYTTTERYVTEFLISTFKTNNVGLSKLSYGLLIKFEHFLRKYKPIDHRKKPGNNAIMKHIQRFSKVVRIAYQIEWIDRNPFKSFKCKFVKSKRTFLSAADLQIIEDKVISVDRLAYIRDLFVFSVYTGFSYIDAINLTMEEVSLGIDGERWIYTTRGKNDQTVRIPLLPKALELINKYKSDPRSVHNGTVFPSISNQKLNAYLKEIAILCGLKSNLTFHVARHTFATTIALSNGLPIETLSRILGHSRISTTQIYAKVIEEKVSSDMKALKNNLSELNNCQEKKSNSQVS